jgi:hypothetical protein
VVFWLCQGVGEMLMAHLVTTSGVKVIGGVLHRLDQYYLVRVLLFVILLTIVVVVHFVFYKLIKKGFQYDVSRIKII